jgi:hypothetical protein
MAQVKRFHSLLRFNILSLSHESRLLSHLYYRPWMILA